jgi:diaminobutyrate-2-oxoglutarate transaminase
MRGDSGARTYARHLPLVPVEGKGVWVRDKSGRWLIDCLSGAGSAILGWGHPVVNAALRSVLDSGAPLLTLDFPTPLRDAFIDELLITMPTELARDAVVHLCAPSGTNAVEAALLAAEIATGRTEHMGVQGGFHGSTRGARSISSVNGGKPLVTSNQRTHLLPFPQHYRCPFDVGGEASTGLAISAAEQALSHSHDRVGGTASLTVECVLGEGGSLPAPAAWLRALRTLTAHAKVPLIADEIQAGMFRTGRAWSFEHSQIVPDMVTISKGLGGGVPIAVVVLKSELNVWGPGVFTGTFRGSSLAFAAATSVLRFAREQQLGAQVQSAGELLMNQLDEVRRFSRTIAEIRGSGLMVGAEIVDKTQPHDRRGVYPAAPELARKIQRLCYDEGLIVEVGGVLGNVIRFLPPLVITDDEIADVVRRFGAAVEKAEPIAAVGMVTA